MKLINLLIAFSLFSFVRCTSGDSPKKVAEAFIKDINNMQYEEAKKLATPETGKMLEVMGSLMGLSSKKDNTTKNFKILSEKIEGDAATVQYQEEGKDIEFIKLVKKNGTWLVAISKEDMATKNMNNSALQSANPLEIIAPSKPDSSKTN
jgi:hypothetical protein